MSHMGLEVLTYDNCRTLITRLFTLLESAAVEGFQLCGIHHVPHIRAKCQTFENVLFLFLVVGF